MSTVVASSGHVLQRASSQNNIIVRGMPAFESIVESSALMAIDIDNITAISDIAIDSLGICLDCVSCCTGQEPGFR